MDLFSGAGGFSLGFAQAGFEIAGALELDEWASETIKYNHPEIKVLTDDIRNIASSTLASEFGKCDVLIGGPPCQGFSVANNANGDRNDPRNTLFMEFLRSARALEPDVVIIENVPNLLKAKTESGQPVIEVISTELEKSGYAVKSEILEATDFGVPQILRRLFIVGHKSGSSFEFPAPTHAVMAGQQSSFLRAIEKTPTLWDAISDLPQIEAREGSEVSEYDSEPRNDYQVKNRRGSEVLYNHVAMKHSIRMVERFAEMRWGQSVSHVEQKHAPPARNSSGSVKRSRYDQNNRRMFPDRPCHTVPASFYANFVHPYRDRNFTAREGARIQSFPDTYRFLGKPTVVFHKLLQREGRLSEKHLCQYNQIGNAVPPLLAQALANSVVNTMVQ